MTLHLSTGAVNDCCGPCQDKARNVSPAMCTSSMFSIASKASRPSRESSSFRGRKQQNGHIKNESGRGGPCIFQCVQQQISRCCDGMAGRRFCEPGGEHEV